MQRLMRSRTEVVFAGVCGGLGNYFGVDPVIVRLIFALVTLTTGLGLIVYPALWIAMPKEPLLPSRPLLDQGDPGEPFVVQRRDAVTAARYGEAPPAPSAYKFDPMTGSRLRPDATFGETTQLPYDPTAPAPNPIPRKRRAMRWIAFFLIGLGGLILADQIGISEIVFPVGLVVLGVFLLWKRS